MENVPALSFVFSHVFKRSRSETLAWHRLTQSFPMHSFSTLKTSENRNGLIGLWLDTVWKVSKYGVFLVRIFPHAGKHRPEKTPYLDTFHAVKATVSLFPMLVQIWKYIFTRYNSVRGVAGTLQASKMESFFIFLCIVCGACRIRFFKSNSFLLGILFWSTARMEIWPKPGNLPIAETSDLFHRILVSK